MCRNAHPQNIFSKNILTQLFLSAKIHNNKSDDEDGADCAFQRVGGWCEPTSDNLSAYHFNS